MVFGLRGLLAQTDMLSFLLKHCPYWLTSCVIEGEGIPTGKSGCISNMVMRWAALCQINVVSGLSCPRFSSLLFLSKIHLCTICCLPETDLQTMVHHWLSPLWEHYTKFPCQPLTNSLDFKNKCLNIRGRHLLLLSLTCPEKKKDSSAALKYMSWSSLGAWFSKFI